MKNDKFLKFIFFLFIFISCGEQQTKQYFDGEREDIHSIKYFVKDKKLEIQKNLDGWEITKSENFSFDQDLIERIIDTLTRVDLIKLLTKRETKFKKFGVDSLNGRHFIAYNNRGKKLFHYIMMTKINKPEFSRGYIRSNNHNEVYEYMIPTKMELIKRVGNRLKDIEKLGNDSSIQQEEREEKIKLNRRSIKAIKNKIIKYYSNVEDGIDINNYNFQLSDDRSSYTTKNINQNQALVLAENYIETFSLLHGHMGLDYYSNLSNPNEGKFTFYGSVCYGSTSKNCDYQNIYIFTNDNGITWDINF